MDENKFDKGFAFYLFKWIVVYLLKLIFVIVVVGSIFGLILSYTKCTRATTSPVKEIQHIDSLQVENSKLVIEVDSLDSIKNVKVIEVKSLDNDSTLRLFYELIGK